MLFAAAPSASSGCSIACALAEKVLMRKWEVATAHMMARRGSRREHELLTSDLTGQRGS
jgi:hypothetical protein